MLRRMRKVGVRTLVLLVGDFARYDPVPRRPRQCSRIRSTGWPAAADRGVTWQQFEATPAARTWAQRANDVIATIKDLDIAIRDAETGQRGYLLTGDNDYLAPYEAALDKVTFLQGDLQRLTSEDRSE